MPPLPQDQSHGTTGTRAVGSWRAGSTTWRGGSDASAPPKRRGLVAGVWPSCPSSLSLVLALAGCSVSGGGGQRTATAVFTDVGDLANGAQVQMADVPVGSVRSIALDGDKAR